jgi:hypothetical protein
MKIVRVDRVVTVVIEMSLDDLATLKGVCNDYIRRVNELDENDARVINAITDAWHRTCTSEASGD